MRIFGKGKASPEEGEAPAAPAVKSEGGIGWLKEHWLPLSLFVIVLAAFLVRFVYAYGISAGDNYALSGGSSASSNLRIVMEIMAGTYDPSSVASLNYPFGSVSAYGPAYDYIMAGIAQIVTAFGISDRTAAAGTIAWAAPILGALTCIVIYGIGKKMYREDRVVGVVSALFYAFFGLIIMTTPFSSGSGFAFICFFASLMVYFILCALKAADEGQPSGPKGVLKDRKVLVPTVLAAVMFGITVLSWTGFWMIFVVIAVILGISLIVQRISGRDMWPAVAIADIILAAGIICAAVWYGAVGQWDAVASGAVVLGVLTAIYATAFACAAKKPWVATIPVFAVVIVAVAVVIMFLDGDLSHAIFHGNSVYSGTLMEDLADNATRTSISDMASYYGWLTLWFPFILGCWMLYRYRAHASSRLYGFSLLYIFSMFFVGWFDSSYAVLAGPAFAAGCGILSVKVIRAVDLKSYFRSLRGNGFKAGARKSLKFFPLATVLIAVFLVAVPNAVLAADAATPSNDEKAGYFGGLSYDIQTSDDSESSALWSYYSTQDVDGGIVTWISNSDYAAEAGFKSVTDSNGGGTVPMSQIYLGSSSANTVAVMTIRMILNHDAAWFDSVIKSVFGDDTKAEIFENLVDDPSAAREAIANSPSDYSGIKLNSLTSENAVYYAASHYLTANLTEAQIQALYHDVCAASGRTGIQYIELDGSMLPLYYGDSSSFSTMAYFGQYSAGNYNAPTYFYSYNAYYGYTSYTSAMYETFLWNALIGIDATGYSNSYALLSALAAAGSDVTVKPLTGIDGFKIAYWHVMYNADDSATSSSSGWTEMDAYEAIAKQKTDGGVINYLSSVMLLEYTADDASSTTETYTGTVTASGSAVEGIRASVYTYDSNLGTYVRGSTAYTASDGTFTVHVPAGSDSYLVLYAGSTGGRDGVALSTTVIDSSTSTSLNLTVTAVTPSSAVITVGGTESSISGTALLEGTASGKTYSVPVSSGTLDLSGLTSGILPDKYTVTVTSENGTTVGTATVIIGDGSDLRIALTGGKVTVTVTNGLTQGYASGTEVTLTETTSGISYTGTTGADGKAVIYVTAGTYAGSVASNGLYGSSSSNTTMSSSGSDRTMTITAYPAESVTVSGFSGDAVVSAVGFSGRTDGSTAYLPMTVTGNTYTVYQLSAGKIAYAVFSASSSSPALTEYDARTVTGTVSEADGQKINATVVFIKSDGAVFTYASVSGTGAYTAYLSDGDYTVYAYGGSEVYYGTLAVSSDATCDISLVSAYSVTLSVSANTNRTSTSSYNYLPYVGVSATVTVDSTDYSFTVLTNCGTSSSSTGRAVIWVPQGSDATVKVLKDDLRNTGMFTMTEDYSHPFSEVSSNSSQSLTFSVSTSSSSTGSQTVNAVAANGGTISLYDSDGNLISLSSAVQYELKSTRTSANVYTLVSNGDGTYKVSYDTSGTIPELMPGQYTISISDDSDQSNAQQYFTSTTVYIVYEYDGSSYSGKAVLDGEAVDIVPVQVKYTQGATVTVDSLSAHLSFLPGYSDYALSDNYWTGSESTTDGVTTVWYYFAKQSYDEIYTIKAVLNSKAATAAVDGSSSASGTTADLTTTYDTVTVTGSLGTDADGVVAAGFYASGSGTLAAKSFAVLAFVSPSDGRYTVELPKDEAGDSYTLYFAFAGIAKNDDAAFSVYAGNSGDSVIEAVSTLTEVSSVSKTTVDADEDSSITYNPVYASDSKVFNTDYTGTVPADVISAQFADGEATVKIKIYNNSDNDVVYYLIGSGSLTLNKAYFILVPANGSTETDVKGIYSADSVGAFTDSLKVAVYSSDGTLADTLPVGAICLEKYRNGNTSDYTFTRTGDTGEVTIVTSGDSALPSQYTGASYRYAVTVTNTCMSLKTVSLTPSASLPDGWQMVIEYGGISKVLASGDTASVVVAGDSVTPVYITLVNTLGDATNAASVTVTGDIAETTLTYQTGGISTTDGSVSGGDADNSEAGISSTFWALTVIAVIIIFMMVYSGSKRGMFSRRK